MVEQPAILLIEDEARLRDNLHTLLQSEGYRVTTAQNGAEGIKCLRKESFALVITDLVNLCPRNRCGSDDSLCISSVSDRCDA